MISSTNLESLTLEEQAVAKQIEAEQFAYALKLHLSVYDWPDTCTEEEATEKSENFAKCLAALSDFYFDCHWWRVFEGVGSKPLYALSVQSRKRALQEYAEHRGHPILESINFLH